VTINGNGRGGTAVAILLIFSMLGLVNILFSNVNLLRPVGGSQG
jgi:hypothetical protein